MWDHPENNIVGPKEVDSEIDKILLEQYKPATTTKTKVYRPVGKLSQDVVPLAHCSNWNNNRIGDVDDIYYLIVEIIYERGFLVCMGISLDVEKEYKTLIL